MADQTIDPRSAILAAEYVALTTYRRDGRAVTTPVWAAERAGKLYILGSAEAGRIKRLRNSPQASVAPCTMSGTLNGATLPATARILDAAESALAWDLIVKKYGLLTLPWRISNTLGRLIGRRESRTAIEVSLLS